MVPHPPNRGTATRSEMASNFQAPEELANFGKLHMASVYDGLEFKPHLRGSWGHGPNQHKRAVPRRGHGAKSLTSTGMLPHCVHEGPSTLGLNRWKNHQPPGVRPTL